MYQISKDSMTGLVKLYSKHSCLFIYKFIMLMFHKDSSLNTGAERSEFLHFLLSPGMKVKVAPSAL